MQSIDCLRLTPAIWLTIHGRQLPDHQQLSNRLGVPSRNLLTPGTCLWIRLRDAAADLWAATLQVVQHQLHTADQ